MWRDDDVLRLAYLPTVWVPLLLAVIAAETVLLQQLHLFLGWSLLLVAQNILNDVWDEEEGTTVSRPGLWILVSVSAFFGLLLLHQTWELAVIMFLLAAAYNKWVNGIPFVEVVVAVAAAVIPYFSIATSLHLFFLLLPTWIAADLLHNMTDADRGIYHSRISTVVMSIVCLGGGGYTAYLLYTQTETVLHTAPFLLFFGLTPFVITRYREPEGKYVAVYSGVLLTLYLLGVVSMYGKLM